MSGTALTALDLTELAPLLRAGQVSPVEVTQAYLDRIAAVDPALNSYRLVLPEAALAAARQAESEIGQGAYRGPLHGVPLGIKDLFDLAGEPTTMGSAILRDNVAAADATVVARLKAAGAVILGKHNLHEFAFGVTSENPHYGDVHNPWDLSRVPGGSSGGTAAAIAAHLCVAGLGSDTGASIRLPASFCGIVGLKPTFGRVSRAGVLPLSNSMDHVGPLSRSVADAALVLQAIAGPDSLDAHTSAAAVADYSADLERGLTGVRVGIPGEFFWDIVEPEVERAVRAAIEVLRAGGASVSEGSLPHLQDAQATGLAIMSSEAALLHADWMAERAAEYGTDVLRRLQSGLEVKAVDYLRRVQLRALLTADFEAAFEQVDVLVAPTVPIVAPPIGRTLQADGPLQLVPRAVANRTTVPCNLTGTPAISVPCGLADGLPVGLQIMGRAFDEQTVLRVAAAYEAATDWRAQRPPTNRDY